MEAAVINSPFNKAQLLLLEAFGQIKNEESFEELRSVLLDFYQKQLDKELDKWWEENNMTTEKFDEMFCNLHFRTPYVTK